MSKATSQPQGVFSFFDEVEKNEPAPKPRLNTLRPPEIIETPADNIAQSTAATPVKEKISAQPIEAPEIDKEPVYEPSTEAGEEAPADAEPERSVQEKAIPTVQAKEINPVVKKSTGTRGRRSVKDNSAAADLIEMPDDEELFKKQYYSMGEVTAMFNENHSLIRYWESEFDILKPKKNGKGDRFFRPIDIKNLHLIYDLLRRRKYTIEGAREYLRNHKSAEEKFAAVQSLQKIKSFFLELKANI